MKPVLVVLAFIFSVATHTTALPGEPLKALEQEVVVLLKTKYAGAGLSKDKHLSYIRRFAANTREFVIYRLNKVGEWQNPLKVQAPNRGGISVRFYVKEGKWVELTEVTTVICIGHENCGGYRAGRTSIVQAVSRRFSHKSVRELQLDHLQKSDRTISRQLGRDVSVRFFMLT